MYFAALIMIYLYTAIYFLKSNYGVQNLFWFNYTILLEIIVSCYWIYTSIHPCLTYFVINHFIFYSYNFENDPIGIEMSVYCNFNVSIFLFLFLFLFSFVLNVIYIYYVHYILAYSSTHNIIYFIFITWAILYHIF